MQDLIFEVEEESLGIILKISLERLMSTLINQKQ